MADTTVTTPVLLTVSDLAEMLNTSSRSIYRLNSQGRLPEPLRLGQQPRWRRAEIEAWVEAGMPLRPDWQWAAGSGCQAVAAVARERRCVGLSNPKPANGQGGTQ